MLLRIVKLLRSDVSADARGTRNFTLCASTILHSGIATAPTMPRVVGLDVTAHAMNYCVLAPGKWGQKAHCALQCV